MSDWKPRRFWKDASTAEAAGGFAVTLDGRTAKTPAGAPLVVPTLALAEAIAAEWAAQEDTVDPAAMPVTRAANAAIDLVGGRRAEVAAAIAAYADSDMLCYRAEEPEELALRQAEAWDPLLDWAASELGARLRPFSGVMHRPQDPAATARLAEMVAALGPFELVALQALVELSGSLVVGFAAIGGAWDAAALWTLSRIDEAWQEERWGADGEAAARTRAREADFHAAMAFHALAAGDSRDKK